MKCILNGAQSWEENENVCERERETPLPNPYVLCSINNNRLQQCIS